MMLTCGSCDAANDSGNRFCGQCAAPLALSCPECGAPADAGQKFCGQCATPLGEPSAAVVPAQPGTGQAENRPVSVLFVDLVGFTTLSESRDAEDVRELLSGYFDTTRTIIGRYGGTVEKFIGDAVMAVWGVPAAHEDDAERAVRAALEIVDAVPVYGTDAGVTGLQARAGVVSGSVSAWAVPGEGIVAGDRVNTAARIQSLAPAGAVYVDDTTRRASSNVIAYADAGEHTAKGKAEPMRLWQAERVVAGVGGAVRVDGLEARLIGRDADLRLVKELFHACTDRRTARLVSVVGAAGVGKSRLRWEFAKYVDGLVDNVLWHDGRCLSYGDGVAYWALAEMVRERFGVAEDEPDAAASARLDDGLTRFIADEADREFLRPRLGVLLGLSGAELGREELFAGWRLLFERLAESEPVVMSFEDLHWADAGLLDFIEHLLDWAADKPIFIITFARPELSDRRPGWATGRRNVTSLYLEALPPAGMAVLLDELVAQLPTSARDRIVEQSEGLPLYAVETVRSLIDRDVVVPKEGVYTVVGEVGDLDVPSTLTSLIAARIDALPQDERSLLQDLSVLGGSFPRAAVAAVTSVESDVLDKLLANLVRKEILTVRAEKLSPDRGQYVFAQTLLRTVAYDMLSKKDRKARHLTVARHLRATFDDDGEDVAEVIATHYRDALLTAENDPDADDIRRDALETYTRAGQRAATLGAPETAETIFAQAADLALDVEERRWFLRRAADMTLVAGGRERVVSRYRALREEYDAEGRSVDSAKLAVGHARGLGRMGQLDEAVEVLQAALGPLDGPDTLSEVAKVTSLLATYLSFIGRIPEANTHAERGLIMAQAQGLPDVLCQALVTRGTVLGHLDRFEESRIHLTAAVDIARKYELTEQEEAALTNVTDFCMTTDDPLAAEFAETALALSRRRGNRYGESVSASNLMYVWLMRGDWHRIETLAAELRHSSDDDRGERGLITLRLATLAAWRGDADACRSAIAAAEPLRASDDVGDITSLAGADAALANVEGRHAGAMTLADSVVARKGDTIGLAHESFLLAWPEAVEAALQLGDREASTRLLATVGDLPAGLVTPYTRAHLLRFRARLAATDPVPDGDRISSDFAGAADQFRALGYRYWLARTDLDHAEWLAGQSRGSEAAAVVDSAAATFEELRAPSWAARARALTGQPVPAG